MGGYWQETYGNIYRSKEFIDGVIAGVTGCAVWKDGAQRVGVMDNLLKESIDDIKEQLGYPRDQGATIKKV